VQKEIDVKNVKEGQAKTTKRNEKKRNQGRCNVMGEKREMEREVNRT